jgi:transforming growth factor-beta-induced protein
MRKLFVPTIAAVAVFAGSAVALAGGGSADDAPAQEAVKPKKTITEMVVGSGRFDTLESLVISADLAETLSGKGPYTVFAPTDKAFSKVPAETLETLGNNPDALRRVLLYHVAGGRYPAARVAGKRSIETLAGPRVKVKATKRAVRVGGARVITADIKASNGVIHALNRVLIPPQ